MTAKNGNRNGTTMNQDQLLSVAESLVAQAASNEQIEVACSYGRVRSLRVYEGELENMTTADNAAIGVRVLADGREGFASAGSLDPDVVNQMLSEARENAKFAEADPHVGIAEPDGVEPVAINLWREEVATTPVEEKVQIALDLERGVRSADPRITGVRVVSYGDNEGSFALASTAGIRASTQATSASVSVQVLAEDGDKTQTGFGWDGARRPGDLNIERVIERAVSRTVDLLGATKPATAKVSLVLDPHLTSTVMGLIAGTLTGDRVIKGRSPFVDRVGEEVATPLLTLVDDATDPESLGADSHDGEGLATRRVPLITDGVLQGFVHDSYTGRRSGHGSTGSAVRGTRGLPSPGVHALAIAPGASGNLDDLIAGVDLGVLVFNLAGIHSGVNAISGDFSVGVEGRMIRNGQLAEPISECTISSTLQRMLLDTTAVGSDLTHLPSGTSAPSTVIGDVMLSGAS